MSLSTAQISMLIRHTVNRTVVQQLVNCRRLCHHREFGEHLNVFVGFAVSNWALLLQINIDPLSTDAVKTANIYQLIVYVLQFFVFIFV